MAIDWPLKKLNLAVPDLKALFDEPVKTTDGGWTVDFSGISKCGYSVDWASIPERKQVVDKLCTAHVHEYSHGHADENHKPAELRKWQAAIDGLNFAERLWMTLRWSDNLAATEAAISIGRSVAPGTANAITLAYIQAVLKESGLGNISQGFWLNYAWQVPSPPFPPMDLWDNSSKQQISDAQSLARLLMAAVTGNLFSSDRSFTDELLGLMRHLDPIGNMIDPTYTNLEDQTNPTVNWANSYTLKGVRVILHGKLDSCVSKLGISGDGDTISDWTIFSSKIGTGLPTYQFGIVVLNGSAARNDISLFAEAFFRALQQGSTDVLD